MVENRGCGEKCRGAMESWDDMDRRRRHGQKDRM
jgi:hypothetical protein